MATASPQSQGTSSAKVQQQSEAAAPREAKSQAVAGIAPSARFEMVSIEKLSFPPRQLRKHPPKQIEGIAKSIDTFGFLVPAVVDHNNVVRAGVGRVMAAKTLGRTEIPVLRAKGLSAAKLRAFTIADNQLGDASCFDRPLLAIELPELKDELLMENLDLSITGLSVAQVDELVGDFAERQADSIDHIGPNLWADEAITAPGDVWQLGAHRVCCEDPRNVEILQKAIEDRRPSLVLIDPTIPIDASEDECAPTVSNDSRGHEIASLVRDMLRCTTAIAKPDALYLVWNHWRNIDDVICAGRELNLAMANLFVWVKAISGKTGEHHRQYELISAFSAKDATAQHIVDLARRPNVWNCRNDCSVDPALGGATGLAKPVELIKNAIEQLSMKGDVILDVYSGYGATILAADAACRQAVGFEIEPRLIDLIIRRWQTFTGKDAIHTQTGQQFAELEHARRRHQ